MNIIKEIPKIELHCHLEGSVRAETIYELAMEQRIDDFNYDIETIRKKTQINGVCNNLREYISNFDLILSIIQTPEALQRISEELIEEAAKQNIIYIEVRFAPQILRQKGLSCFEVISNVISGLKKSGEKYGVIVNSILICLRSHTVQQNLEVIDLARYFLNNGVVAIDLAGDEASYPPLLHLDVFDRAKEYNIPFTIHAGESGDPQSIKEALLLGASRLGHGIKSRYDKNLIYYLTKKQIGLEMCPSSNIQTHAVEGWDDYPVREYFDQGLAIAICVDNPYISNTSLIKEFNILVEKYKFSYKEIKKLIINAVDMSFAEEKIKSYLRSIINNFKD